MAEEEVTERSFTDTLKKYAVPIAVLVGIMAGVLILTYLIAVYGGGHLLTEPFFGGVFNYPILFGVQVYFWVFILAFIVAVGFEIFWRVSFWEPITPFHGLYKAFVDNTKAALVGDLNLDWALLSESGATIIFMPEDYKFAIEDMGWWIRFRAWLYKPDFSAAIAATLEGKRNEPTMLTIGRIPTHLIIDTEWWTDKKSHQRQAIIVAAKKWNMENINDQIHRFTSFIEKVEKGLITCPPGVILKRRISWARIDAAFPVVRSDAAWAGFVRQIAEDLQGASNSELNRWAAYVLIFSAAICIMMFVTSWIFPAHPAAVAAAATATTL